MDKVFKLTAEKLEQLKEELVYLKTVREKEVAEQIKEARSFGDLSENSEYDEAKTEQGKLYSKIAEIKYVIDNAELIVKNSDTNEVGIGNRVTVKDMADGNTEVYQIVGSQEMDPAAGKVSDESPFGKGLMGHKVGEIIEIEAPNGTMEFEIVEIAGA